MADDLQQIVERMVAAGESEDNIAAVIQHYKAPAAPPAQEKSVGGFLGNVLSSGGQFLSNLVGAVPAAGQAFMAGARAMGDMSPQGQMARASVLRTTTALPGAIKQMAGERYGSLEKAGNTLYQDPVGALADVATLAGGAGLAAKAGGAPRIARAANAVERVTNPMTAVGKVAEPVLHKAAQTVVKGTLRPSKAIRDDFGGADGVADAVLKEKVFSEASSAKKLKRSTTQADKLIADAEAAGVPGVSRSKVGDAVLDKPLATAQRRADLGAGDASDSLLQRAMAIEGQGGEFPLTQAQTLKREAQDLAYEASKSNLGLEQQANAAIARALREGIEQQVPAVGPVNERSQRLLGAQRAFAEAQDRPNALTNMLALGAGGTVGAGSGDILSGLMTAAAMKAMNSPRVGAATGIALDSFGQGLSAEGLRKAALLARLADEVQ